MRKKRRHTIKLEIGKFYRVLDGSQGGHPGQIFKIDSSEKVFFAVMTGSMSNEEFRRYGIRKGYFKLTHQTDKNVDISLVKKRPFKGDRDDFGDKEYEDMQFSGEDIYIIVKVQKNNPILG